MLLRFDNGEPYATGAAFYDYRPATEKESSLRIVLTVSIEDIKTSAFVDTGGYFLIPPDIADILKLDHRDGAQAPDINWRGYSLSGLLHRVFLTFHADEGNSLTIEATAFVPQMASYEQWPKDFPCILGMNGCFERLRFAIDPHNNTFFFGDLAEN